MSHFKAKRFWKIIAVAVVILIVFSYIPLSIHQFDIRSTGIRILNQRIERNSSTSARAIEANINDLVSTNPPFYIFQIGFNKCGTQSLVAFFVANNISSIHYALESAKGYPMTLISSVMNKRYRQHQPLLMDFADRYVFFSDFGAYFSQHIWHALFEQYPNSKFILNVRPPIHYFKSKYLHYKNRTSCFLIDCGRKHKGMDSDMNVIRKWNRTFYKHACEVRNFFQIHGASRNLLVFDIEHESIKKLIKFFGAFNISLDESLWQTVHVTNKRETALHIHQSNRWDALTLKYPQLRQREWNNATLYSHIFDAC